MIFNEDLIFIHIGKTGGMSCAGYLLSNLRPTVYNCHTESEGETIEGNPDGIVAVTALNRHCPLSAALSFIGDNYQRELADFDKVLAVVRNPYSLEYSFYNHLRKPHVQERRREKSPHLIELASGPFQEFVKHGGYHRPGMQQQDFFLLDGEAPKQLEVIRFEEMQTTLPAAVSKYRRSAVEVPFPHLNATQYRQELDSIMTPEIENLIYLKHQYMFDSGLYSRL